MKTGGNNDHGVACDTFMKMTARARWSAVLDFWPDDYIKPTQEIIHTDLSWIDKRSEENLTDSERSFIRHYLTFCKP